MALFKKKFKGKTAGVTSDGEPIRLGDTDEQGYFIGYIDDEGNPWESILERDESVTFGRFDEARMEWHDGLRKTRPNVWVFALRYCDQRTPGHLRKVVAEVKDSAQFWESLRKRVGRI